MPFSKRCLASFRQAMCEEMTRGGHGIDHYSTAPAHHTPHDPYPAGIAPARSKKNGHLTLVPELCRRLGRECCRSALHQNTDTRNRSKTNLKVGRLTRDCRAVASSRRPTGSSPLAQATPTSCAEMRWSGGYRLRREVRGGYWPFLPRTSPACRSIQAA